MRGDKAALQARDEIRLVLDLLRCAERAREWGDERGAKAYADAAQRLTFELSLPSVRGLL